MSENVGKYLYIYTYICLYIFMMVLASYLLRIFVVMDVLRFNLYLMFVDHIVATRSGRYAICLEYDGNGEYMVSCCYHLISLE